MKKITPNKITKLEPNQIFVFGSNLAGRHGRGAALDALRKFGAKNGQGLGLMGQSYGIATKTGTLKVMSLRQIETQIERFVKFAKDNPELEFLVTPIGCGLAGYKSKEIAPLFKEVPNNVSLPESFWKYIKEEDK